MGVRRHHCNYFQNKNKTAWQFNVLVAFCFLEILQLVCFHVDVIPEQAAITPSQACHFSPLQPLLPWYPQGSARSVRSRQQTRWPPRQPVTLWDPGTMRLVRLWWAVDSDGFTTSSRVFNEIVVHGWSVMVSDQLMVRLVNGIVICDFQCFF